MTAKVELLGFKGQNQCIKKVMITDVCLKKSIEQVFLPQSNHREHQRWSFQAGVAACWRRRGRGPEHPG